MLSSMGVLLVSAALGGDASPSVNTAVYDDYKPAYLAAKSANRPLLVIINPGTEGDAKPLELDDLTRSGHRRAILGDYVVAVIDASTPEGQKAHKLFGSPALPRVSVIDKQQKWQIYRTSKSLNAEDWNIVLAKYRKGQAPAPVAPPTCPCMLGSR